MLESGFAMLERLFVEVILFKLNLLFIRRFDRFSRIKNLLKS